jgi:hypothetical protein
MAKECAERNSKSQKDDSQEDKVGSKRVRQQAKRDLHHQVRHGRDSRCFQSSNNRLFKWILSPDRQGAGQGKLLPVLISYELI